MRSLLASLTMVIVLQVMSTVIAFAQPDPQLVAVNVSFHLPKCDDKDHDTNVYMSVVQGGTTIASADDIAHDTQFKDPGDYGPYPFVLVNTITKSAFPGTTTKLHITTKGKDTWCTKISIDALFADNTHLSYDSCVVIKVSEANHDAQFINQPCQ
jgi:hypothetical protein